MADGIAHRAVDVEVLGPATWNQLVYLDRLPDPRPQMAFASDSWETVGGTSAGKALHLADRGRSHHLHTVLGDDTAGMRVRAALGAAGVALQEVDGEGPTERHLNLMTGTGERLSIGLAAPSAVRAGDLTDHLAAARAVVLDLSPWTRALAESVAATGVPVWTDLHDYDGRSPFHEPFLAVAAYVALNADALTNPLEVMHRIVDHGARVVVCTLGAEGAVAVDRRHQEHRVPAEPVDEVVDTNGAGDAFFAGFLDATLDGAELSEALTAGAGQATRALGSRHLSPLVPDAPAATGRGDGSTPAPARPPG